MFAFTKVIKLVGLFRRNPSDLWWLPVSILFGYFHGLVKLYALITLNMVCFARCLPMGGLLTWYMTLTIVATDVLGKPR